MSSLLVPGGALIFHEPCLEGFVFLGLLTLDFEIRLKQENNIFKKIVDTHLNKHIHNARNIQETMLYSARQDIDKSSMENKHIFRTEYLFKVGRELDLDVEFISNHEFNEFDENGSYKSKKGFFREFSISYLKIVVYLMIII